MTVLLDSPARGSEDVADTPFDERKFTDEEVREILRLTAISPTCHSTNPFCLDVLPDQESLPAR